MPLDSFISVTKVSLNEILSTKSDVLTYFYYLVISRMILLAIIARLREIFIAHKENCIFERRNEDFLIRLFIGIAKTLDRFLCYLFYL